MCQRGVCQLAHRVGGWVEATFRMVASGPFYFYKMERGIKVWSVTFVLFASAIVAVGDLRDSAFPWTLERGFQRPFSQFA